MGISAIFLPGAECFVRARVTPDTSDICDVGDHVRVRVGDKGNGTTFWVPRSQIVAMPPRVRPRL